MKTWKRGRRKATNEQKEKAAQWQRERVKITNIVARKYDLEKKCCICGKAGTILHNKENPYYITFICKSCREDFNKLKEAEKYRFDLKEYVNKSKVGVRNYSMGEIKELVENYPENVNFGEFCRKNNISRYIFNQLINKYCVSYPNKAFEIRTKIFGTPKIMK